MASKISDIKNLYYDALFLYNFGNVTISPNASFSGDVSWAFGTDIKGTVKTPTITKEVAKGETVSGSFGASVNAYPGDKVTYKITVNNQGDSLVTINSITDSLPTGLINPKIYTNGSWTSFSGNTVATNATLPKSGKLEYYISAEIDPNINLNGGNVQLNNSASMTPKGVSTITSQNATVTVQPPPYGKITITASGLDAGQNSVYRVTGSGVDLTVTMENSNSVTITNLPAGSYTVTPVGDWTSRYTTSAQNVTVASGGTANAPFTFSKKSTTAKWLYGFDSEENNFAGLP